MRIPPAPVFFLKIVLAIQGRLYFHTNCEIFLLFQVCGKYLWLFHKDCTESVNCSGFSTVQLLSRVRRFVTPWTAACQASLSITNSRNLLKLTPIESVMPSNHLILCRPFLLPPSIFSSIRVFLMNQLFASGGQNIGVSASASVLPMNIQG